MALALCHMLPCAARILGKFCSSFSPQYSLDCTIFIMNSYFLARLLYIGGKANFMCAKPEYIGLQVLLARC